jgi:hypothetical protein
VFGSFGTWQLYFPASFVNIFTALIFASFAASITFTT